MVKYLAILILLAGCKSAPQRHVAETPSVVVGQAGDVAMKGDTPNPAKVNTSTSESVMPIPEGSTFVFNEKAGTLALTLSKATQIAVNRKETMVEGAVAFTPDKAPTLKEEKDAQSDYWVKLGLYAAVFVGGGAAIFGLVRGWNLVMLGGGSTLGAGLFGLFIERHPLILVVIGVGVALKFAGPYLWHFHLKPKENGQPSQ